MKLPIRSFEKKNSRREIGSANDFIDVTPKKPRWLYPLAAAGVALAGLLAIGIWQGPYQSWQDRKEVEKAMAMTDSGATIPTWEKLERQNLQKNPEPVRLYLTSKLLNFNRSKEGGNDLALQKAVHAALREAARQGSALAALELVKLKKVSTESNFKEISLQLDDIHERVQLGVKVGDATSMYALAVMKSEGLGAAVDMEGAAELARRAAKDLPPGLQEFLLIQASYGIGIFENQNDEQLAKLLGHQLLEKKYYGRYSPCGITRNFVNCLNKWVSESAIAGNPLYFSDFANLLLRDEKADIVALEWLKKAPEDTLGTYDTIILSFGEWLDSGITPARLKKLFTSRDALSLLISKDGFNFNIVMLSNSLGILENGRDDASLKKIVAVAHGLYDLQGDSAPFWVKDNTISKKNNPYRWQKLFNNPRVARAGKALSNALQTGNGLSAALERIDMLDQPEPAPIPQAKPAIKYLTEEEVFGSRPLPIQQAKPAQSEATDKDYRAKSGPIGSQSALGGLSSFTVDNSQGDQDVVVRLYRDGKLPAVRSFLVKKEDTYTSGKITAGNYVMRHRLIGSDKTYEADEVFRLAETRIDGGIQYSRMRVTMFKVENGNLINKEVSSDMF